MSNPAADPPKNSNAAPATEASGSGTAVAPAKPALDKLGALEEDDEFEDFPTEDWPDSATLAANLPTTDPKTGKPFDDPAQQLWEDNWDDDDRDVAFTKQLRAELKAGDEAMKM